MSLSARRAWIEISYGALDGASEIVALRKESVDRNTNPGSTTLTFPVALRKESVDRNWMSTKKRNPTIVALRKESVDRNIGVGTTRDSRGVVALRKESVDRNIPAHVRGCDKGRRSPQGERG